MDQQQVLVNQGMGQQGLDELPAAHDNQFLAGLVFERSDGVDDTALERFTAAIGK